jgi:ankyrin repeat protein
VPTSSKERWSTNAISSPARNADIGPRWREVVVNLDQLRKQAKELVKAARTDDPEARMRLGGRHAILASAQLVIAREQGYPSWPALVSAAEANAAGFVSAATSGRCRRAEAMLEARPEIETDPWARLVLGREWKGDPTAAGGPRGWAPILYVCHSCFASATLVRELLARGADANAFFVNEYGQMSALYGAAGVAHDPELTRVLLEAGANPDDGESLYHATEAESPECVRILLEHGATATGSNALGHALDEEHLEHVRLLLEHGADPNEGAILAHAVRRGRGPEFLRLLAEHGADLDRPGGETWRGDVPLRTPYQHAVIRSRTDQAETLAELGASTAVDPQDLAVAAVARGERPDTPLPDELDPDAQEVVIEAALNGHLDLVVELMGPNFSGVIGGSPDGTLLHWGAWVGSPEMIRTVLDRGADPAARSEADYDTPLGWAAYGSQHHERPGRDYVAAAELLVEAGNVVEPRLLDVAQGPLYDWLDERLEVDD